MAQNRKTDCEGFYRRDFLKVAGAGAVAAAISTPAWAETKYTAKITHLESVQQPRPDSSRLYRTEKQLFGRMRPPHWAGLAQRPRVLCPD